MAADFVADGCRWTDPESERLATLPVGATREVRAVRRKGAKTGAPVTGGRKGKAR